MTNPQIFNIETAALAIELESTEVAEKSGFCILGCIEFVFWVRFLMPSIGFEIRKAVYADRMFNANNRAPSAVLPNMPEPTAAITNPGPGLLQSTQSEMHSFSSIIPDWCSPKAVFPPIGKPHTSPKTKAEAHSGGIPVSAENGAPISLPQTFPNPARSSMADTQRNGKSAGISRFTQMSSPLETEIGDIVGWRSRNTDRAAEIKNIAYRGESSEIFVFGRVLTWEYVFTGETSHIIWYDKIYVENGEIYMKRKKLRESPSVTSLARESSVFLLGDHEMTVNGCVKVVSYSPENVRLQNCDGFLDVKGKGLTVGTYFGSEIKLKGTICEIKFSEDGCDA